MDLFNKKALGLAYRNHIEQLETIDSLEKAIAVLKRPDNLAREAIDRFCHPELLESAHKWLDSKLTNH